MRFVVSIALTALLLVGCGRKAGAPAVPDAGRRAPSGTCSLDGVREVCNGLDDDCNGVIDDGARCPSGQRCVGARCQ